MHRVLPCQPAMKLHGLHVGHNRFGSVKHLKHMAYVGSDDRIADSAPFDTENLRQHKKALCRTSPSA